MVEENEDPNDVKMIGKLILSLFKKRTREAVLVFLLSFTIWLLYNIEATKFAYILKYLAEEIGAFQLAIFTGIMRGVCGFMIPYLFSTREESMSQFSYFILFYTIFYAITSIKTIYFFLSLDILFGSDTNLLTISKKVAVDLFIVTPLVFNQWYVFGHLFGAHYCNIFKFYDEVIEKKMFSWQGIIFDWWLPTWICILFIWLPSLVVIYGVPLHLQIVIANLIGSFSVIIIADIAVKEKIIVEDDIDCSVEEISSPHSANFTSIPTNGTKNIELHCVTGGDYFTDDYIVE